MSQIELSLSEQQLALEKKADAGLKARIEELRALVAKGESIPVRNPPQAILTEDKAKGSPLPLRSPACPAHPFHPGRPPAAQRGADLGQGDSPPPGAPAYRVLRQSRPAGPAAERTAPGAPGLERGAQYLRKQPELARYQAELQQMEAQLARANAMVLNNSQPASEEPSELNEGLKALDADDLWKKKNVYD